MQVPAPFEYLRATSVEHAIGLLLTLGYTNKTIRAERFGPTGA